MSYNKIYYFFIVSCICLFCSCGPNVEKIPLNNNIELHRQTPDGKWALFNKATDSYVSDWIYDGYEPMNLADIAGSESIFILKSNGKKYLYDAYSSKCEFLLDGHPYSSLGKDMEGGIYAQTEAGVYLLNRNSNLPKRVSAYHRSGNSFIYTLDGEHYGVFYHSYNNKNVWDNGSSYKPIIAPKYHQIIHVLGDGADHFVARENNKWVILDVRGRQRDMCVTNIMKNFYSLRVFPYERNATSYYLKIVRSVPLGTSDKYIASFRTRCTHQGDERASTILLKRNKDKWNSLFNPYGQDASNTQL